MKDFQENKDWKKKREKKANDNKRKETKGN